MTHDCVNCGAELHMHCPHCDFAEIAALKAERQEMLVLLEGIAIQYREYSRITGIVDLLKRVKGVE